MIPFRTKFRVFGKEESSLQKDASRREEIFPRWEEVFYQE